MRPFPDRTEAGRLLGAAVRRTVIGPAIVLGLPRGGVPVAAQVAAALGAPLDVLVVRKLGTPGHLELAMGAVASGGVRVLNDGLLRRLQISADEVDSITIAERRELERRERAYRGDRPLPDVTAGTVVVVDDGLATGATARAAVQALRQRGAQHVVLAVPVGAPDCLAHLRTVADDVVCLHAPGSFRAVGFHYSDFSPISDDEVCRILQPASEQ